MTPAAVWVLALGPEIVVNDPFNRAWGARIGVEHCMGEHIRMGASVSGYPVQHDAYYALVTQLVDASTDSSWMRWRAQGEVGVVAFHGRSGRLDTSVQGGVGLGVVRTEDDLEALQAEGDPRAEATQLQFLPAASAWLAGEARGDRYGLRLRVEQLRYVETVDSLTIETKVPLLVSAEVQRWF